MLTKVKLVSIWILCLQKNWQMKDVVFITLDHRWSIHSPALPSKVKFILFIKLHQITADVF